LDGCENKINELRCPQAGKGWKQLHWPSSVITSEPKPTILISTYRLQHIAVNT